MARQITWIKKPGGSHNPATHIAEVGGSGWAKLARDVIYDIINNRESYFVSVNGISVSVGIGIHNGYYYLRTHSDGTPLDNLLSLTNVATT
jgi:hypothetical protein